MLPICFCAHASHPSQQPEASSQDAAIVRRPTACNLSPEVRRLCALHEKTCKAHSSTCVVPVSTCAALLYGLDQNIVYNERESDGVVGGSHGRVVADVKVEDDDDDDDDEEDEADDGLVIDDEDEEEPEKGKDAQVCVCVYES